MTLRPQLAMPQQTPEGQSQAAIPNCGGFWEARMLPVPLVLSWVQTSLVPAPRSCLVLQEGGACYPSLACQWLTPHCCTRLPLSSALLPNLRHQMLTVKQGLPSLHCPRLLPGHYIELCSILQFPLRGASTTHQMCLHLGSLQF